MAQVNIRVDDDLKEKGEALFSSLGLTFSSAVNIFLSQAVREGGLPFAVTTRTERDPFYSKENLERLQKSITQMESTGGTVHEVPLDD
ncbi:MAG: type II toxin-antitoxin system RelB/DinJ family antitoxin [Lacrimispora sp.]|uniref:type II toxin-antitoxin system RelB/DinJ family antitoxin n=1 Tax=Lacrimispora sp. TaxID=2719234 RepID=UPI0039E6F77C